eukprot:gene8536-13186_t
MAQHMKQNQVDELSMPEIGCGLDGLKWPDVAEIIKEVFAGMPSLKISVHHLRYVAPSLPTPSERMECLDQ